MNRVFLKKGKKDFLKKMQTNGTADEEAQMSIMREHLLNAGLHVEGELLFFCTEESSLSRY